jgi:hypothetical protein
MNHTNVRRLLSYLEQLKAQGEEDKWVMHEYLADREEHDILYPEQITNWHCGTAGCLAGSWAIIKVKEGGEPPVTLADVIAGFGDDFGVDGEARGDVIQGAWSPNGIRATLDEAIAYLRLCLEKGTMDVRLGS